MTASNNASKLFESASTSAMYNVVTKLPILPLLVATCPEDGGCDESHV